MTTALEAQDDEFERTMHPLKYGLAILEPKESCDTAGLKQHVPQLHGPKVGVDAGGDDDAGASAVTEEVDILFEEVLE
jgi:hypothetical protein